jgi:hypothetical protein
MSPYIPNFKGMDTGPSDFDFNQTFVISYVWQLPEMRHANAFVRGVAGGWEVTGITTVQTGPPLTLFAGSDRSGSAIGEDHAQYLGGKVYTSGPCANQSPCVSYINASSFALPPLGTYGNTAKGTLRGPGFFNTDLGMFKNFRFRESLNLQFRAEMFNVFNRANFNNPGTSLSGGFGNILSARDPRIGQLALKFEF